MRITSSSLAQSAYASAQASRSAATIRAGCLVGSLIASLVASASASAEPVRHRAYSGAPNHGECRGSRTIDTHCRLQAQNPRLVHLSTSCVAADNNSIVYFLFQPTPAEHLIRKGDVVNLNAPPCDDAIYYNGPSHYGRTIMATKSYNLANGSGTPITVVFGREVSGSHHASGEFETTLPETTLTQYYRLGLYPYGLN